MAQSNAPSNIVCPNGLLQDAQGRWQELLSPTQLLTGQEQNLDNNNEKQPKKKKRHGNRKRQHQRRRLRRQQHKQNNTTTNHTNQDILIVIDDTDDNPEEDNEEQPIQQNVQNNQHRTGLENKRKRQEPNEDDIQVSRSFSQLSISQRNLKKTKSTIGNNSSNKEISNVVTDTNEKLQQQQQQKKQEGDNDLLPTNYVQQFKPCYLKVSDKIFTRMLSNSIEDGNKIVQCLNTNEKLQFVRQMAEKTNNLYYFDLQRQLWQDYFDLGMKENKWAPRVSKSFAKQHHTCRTYGFRKHIVEQRLQTITQQFQRTINELQQYILQSEQNVKHWQPYIHPAILSNAIHECVKSAQQRLRQEFDYKKKMLALDSNDHSLITKFYDLKPNEEQIQLAKQISQTTASILKTKAQEEIL
ncbi:unnamed protein product, partial [Rotaria sordida]